MSEKGSKGRQAGSMGVAMAGAILLSWAAGQVGVEVPGEVQAAVAVLIGWAARQLA